MLAVVTDIVEVFVHLNFWHRSMIRVVPTKNISVVMDSFVRSEYKNQISASMQLTIGSGGRHNTLAGDFCCSELTSGFWKVYTVKAGRWWPFSYAVDIVWGRSTVVVASWECGGHVDTACVGFVDVVDVCELKFSNFCSYFQLFNWFVEQKTKIIKRKKK